MDFLKDESVLKVVLFTRDTFMPPLVCKSIEISGPENEFAICKDALAIRYKFPENIYQQDDMKSLSKYKDYLMEWDVCEFSTKKEVWLLKKGLLGIFDAHPYIAQYYNMLWDASQDRIKKEIETMTVDENHPGLFWSQFSEDDAPHMNWNISLSNGMPTEKGPGIDDPGRSFGTIE